MVLLYKSGLLSAVHPVLYRTPPARSVTNRGAHPDVDEDGVACPLCRNRSPVRSDDLEKVIAAWNAMVDPGERGGGRVIGCGLRL
jgi:hypothetical protein